MASQAFIFIVSGFDELPAITAVTYLRQQGISTYIVSPKLDHVVGKVGVIIHPDIQLEDVIITPRQQTVQIMILVGNSGCLTKLLIDPRILKLAQKMMESGGHIASLQPDSSEFLANWTHTSPFLPSQYHEKGTEAVETFIEKVILLT